MKIKELLHKMQKYIQIPDYRIAENALISNMRMFQTGVNATGSNTMYIILSPDNFDVQNAPANVMICGRKPDALDERVNYICVSPEDLPLAINIVRDVIECERGSAMVGDLYSVLNSCTSISEALDQAALLLDNSLILFDESYTVVGYSRSIPVVDPIWQETIRCGYCEYEIIRLIQRDFENNSSPGVADVTCDRSPFRKFRNRIFYQGHPVASLLMICSASSITPAKQQMFEELNTAILQVIRKYASYLLEPGNDINNILYGLLTGATQEDFTVQLEHFPLPKKMIMFAIHPDRFLGKEYIKKAIVPELQAVLSRSKFFFPGPSVAVMSDFSISPEDEQIGLRNLEKLAERYHLRIGISLPFEHIISMRQYYEQALRSLELGQAHFPEKRIIRYVDVQFFDLLSALSVDNPQSLGRFCHPALAELRRFDQDHNTELYKTLKVFLENNCQPLRTSEALYIHRNSLTRRLDKISEICRFHSDDPVAVLSLRVSFGIDKYLKQDQ